ncbi:Speract/scavenger receptor [Metarhizium album ARSEF 1941]|uniref:Speract/scavenger receptor n=1 Tax=Metarhizium album (strain ARSEF 1941) TaxID=1081103 RepID=A0A0B2WE82_METAS|nr:Speract/scavenger receptor [Metarhizium album ARSEF 1941]KHN94166.1 Speract/scavenger receptor [Metarhizium album ARSEF 1941]
MNNFGVIELASAKTTSAPGWAYVPDTAMGPGSAGMQPANRKRARNPTGGGPSLGDLTARQETKMRKEVEALERDGSKDNTIPLPAKGGRTQTKFTPNVRKVMQSQKTFANHLDDYLALQALEAQPSSNASKRPAAGKRDTATSTPKNSTHDDDVVMADDLPPVLPPPFKAPPAPHPGDDDPLLVSRVPEMPAPAVVVSRDVGGRGRQISEEGVLRGLRVLGTRQVFKVRDQGLCVGLLGDTWGGVCDSPWAVSCGLRIALSPAVTMALAAGN